MEYIILDIASATEEQLRATIEYNNRTYRLMTSEIAKLKKVASSTKSISAKKEQSDEQVEAKEEVSSKDDDFENEVDYYYASVRELTEENLEDELEEALPSRKNYQYKRILLRIQAEIMRNIKEIKDFLMTEDISMEDALDLQAEILFEKRKLELISQQLSAKPELLETSVQPENNLILVPTTGGNIRVLEEIEHIDPEYYERFNGLFKSIKDGTFKNVQRFSRNSDLAGLCEVKDFKTRIVFKRLSKNSYAIISAFVKKTDNDKGYRNMLASRYSDYLKIEDRLIANLANEEFMSLHKEYEEELFNKISSEKAIASIKIKAGGQNV